MKKYWHLLKKEMKIWEPWDSQIIRKQAVTDTKLKINVEKRVISLNLQIDPKICSMYEYFEIFLGRMMMCKRAAEVLEASFRLTVNGAKVL